MKNKINTFFFLLIILPALVLSQLNTFSPYSRYGLGEMSPTTFAHNSGMGGTYIALKPDSTMPIFINTGNPASYSLIKLTTLEVGGSFLNSNFTSGSNLIKKWTTNFSYGALGFPVMKNGGACFGIMPYTNVGYETQAISNESGIGNVTYNYNGGGGLNKAFIGYGVMPFKLQVIKFKNKRLYIPDSLKRLSKFEYNSIFLVKQIMSDLSIGFNANYIFGNIQNNTKVIYPNSQLYNNTKRVRSVSLGNFTANFGAQTAISIDSVKSKNGKKRVLNEKLKFTFGYFMALNNSLKANYNTFIYNYTTDNFGNEFIRDTVFSQTDKQGDITLPIEQGFGLGFKKGERLNIVADFAVTNWQDFKYLDAINEFKNNTRVSVGASFLSEKYAVGNLSYFRRIIYRMGASYQSGYIDIKKTLLADYSITAGIGLPVGIGRSSSMVNISTQYGQMGTSVNNLIKDNYWRINIGFTFCDRWFQKFKYD